jgi:hypothetical protein
MWLPEIKAGPAVMEVAVRVPVPGTSGSGRSFAGRGGRPAASSSEGKERGQFSSRRSRHTNARERISAAPRSENIAVYVSPRDLNPLIAPQR